MRKDLETLPQQIRKVRLHIPAAQILPFDSGASHTSEQYRILRAKLSQHPKHPRFITISSPGTGDGKTVNAVNIAGALSLKSDTSVLLLEADLRRPSIQAVLGLPSSPGLPEVLAGACDLAPALIQTQQFPNLYVLSAGRPPMNPTELLDGASWPALCSRLLEMFRYVIVDSSPVTLVAEYELIQAVCDGVILVIRPDYTNRQAYEQALKAIPQAKLLGVLLNCVPEWPLARRRSSAYYYQVHGQFAASEHDAALSMVNLDPLVDCLPDDDA